MFSFFLKFLFVFVCEKWIQVMRIFYFILDARLIYSTHVIRGKSALNKIGLLYTSITLARQAPPPNLMNFLPLAKLGRNLIKTTGETKLCTHHGHNKKLLDH